MSEDPIVALKGQVEALEWQRTEYLAAIDRLRGEVEAGSRREAALTETVAMVRRQFDEERATVETYAVFLDAVREALALPEGEPAPYGYLAGHVEALRKERDDWKARGQQQADISEAAVEMVHRLAALAREKEIPQGEIDTAMLGPRKQDADPDAY